MIHALPGLIVLLVAGPVRSTLILPGLEFCFTELPLVDLFGPFDVGSFFSFPALP